MSCNISCCLPEGAPFHDYDDVIRHLDGLGVFHMDMGLGRMERALAALGLDRLRRPTVQVAGTNGKGSTSSFLQAIAMAHNLTTGLYTSPHFVAPEERIRVDRATLPRAAWASFASRAVMAEAGLTYFELLTVMAAETFELSSCDLIIYEAGLGGRYDATSALPAHMTCFVPVDLDHVEVLGRTIGAIAADKADAMQNGRLAAVSAPQHEEARRALERRAEELGIPLCSSETLTPASCGGTASGQELFASLSEELRALAVLPEDAKLGLHGPHQRMNAQTALLVWVLLCQRFGWKTDRETILRGLASAFIPGRMQYAPASGDRPALWLDGAHNVHGMTALTAALGGSVPAGLRPGAVVFSCLRDKEPQKLTAMLRAAVGEAPIFVPEIKDNPRAASKEELAALIGPQARPAASLEAALDAAAKAAKGTPVLICGSLYLLGDVFSRFPELLSPQSDQH